MSWEFVEDDAAKRPMVARMMLVYVGDQLCGIGASEVSEVLREPILTPIPFTKKMVRGLSNLRGFPLVVFDLSAALEIAPQINSKDESLNTDKSRMVLVVEIDGDRVGLLVDRIDSVEKIRLDRVVRDLSKVPDAVAGFISGVYQGEAGKVYLLNIPGWYESQDFVLLTPETGT